MATLFSSLASGKSPTMLYTITYTQTGRAASTVTYDVTCKAVLENPSTGYFNADVYPKIKIGSKTVSFDDLGPFPKGTSAKTSKKSITVSASAGTSSLSYTFSATTQLGGTSSSSTGYVAGKTGTIPCSIFATTPSLSGSLVVKDGSTTLSSYFRENIGSTALSLSWSKATNANGTLRYELRRSINGADFVNVNTALTGTSTTNAPGAVNTVRYAVRAKNTVGDTTLYSAWVYSNTFTKNSFSTNPTVTSSASVSYATKSFTFTVGAAKDRLGSAMTYTIAGISPTAITGTTTIGTGSRTINTQVASGTYMTLTQLKNATGNTSTYKGTLKFRITARNAYGSTKTVDLSVPIDLGKDAPVSGTPSLSVNSGSYFSIGGTNYIFPEYKSVSLAIASGVQDALGRYCSFDLLMVEGSTTKTIKNTGTISVTTATNVSVSSTEAGMGTAKKTVQFKIRAKTPNGVTKESSATASLDLHYYKKPTITANSITRESGKASFKIAIKQNSSLTGTNTRTNPGGWTESGLTTSGGNQNYQLSRSGLTESHTEKPVVKVRDSVGIVLKTDGSLDASVTVTIPSFAPMFSIRKKGVGVNCIPNTYKFQVNGTSYFAGGMTYFGSDIQMNDRVIKFTTANTGYPRIGYETSSEDTFISGAGNNWLRLKKDGSLTWKGSNVITAAGGTITSTLYVKNSSSGITGSLWSGTGGFVVQAEEGANLHLGANNSSTDMTFYSDKIDIGKNVYTGNYIYMGDGKSRISSNVFTLMNVTDRWTNIYLGPASDGEARVCAWGDVDNGYRPIRASHFYSSSSGSSFAGNAVTMASNGVFASTAGYVVIRSVADSNIYLQGAQTRAVAVNTTTTYRPMYASAFNQSSTGTAKTKIQQVDGDDRIDTMQILKDTNVYTYHLIDEVDRGYYYNKKIGLIAEATPRELKAEDEQAIDLYSMTSTLWDVCKKQQETIEKQQVQIEELWEMIDILCENQELAVAS